RLIVAVGTAPRTTMYPCSRNWAICSGDSVIMTWLSCGHLALQPRHAIGAAGIDQGPPRFRQFDVDDIGDEHRMRAPVDLLHDRAVEGDEGVVERRRAGGEASPAGARELVAIVRLAAPGEAIGDLGLLGAQHVDAEAAVPLDRLARRTGL